MKVTLKLTCFFSNFGTIVGAKVHAIYVRSRLDSPTLAQIWYVVKSADWFSNAFGT